MSEPNGNTKQIVMENSTNKPVKKEPKEAVMKEKTKRVVTQTLSWKIKANDLDPNNQLTIARSIFELSKAESNSSPLFRCVRQQLDRKIYGYKTQDLEKSLYSETEFVDFPRIMELFLECEMKCYYCKQIVLLLYEYVREPRQWSLERFDNKFGHNKNNVTIACLNCNLRRRTMYPERYVFTKQLHITKTG
jgi:hypothetical protein